jgi:hypothetical protein
MYCCPSFLNIGGTVGCAKEELRQPYETLLTRSVKETYQEIPDSEYTFTDPHSCAFIFSAL